MSNPIQTTTLKLSLISLYVDCFYNDKPRSGCEFNKWFICSLSARKPWTSWTIMNLAQNVAKLHPGTDIVSMALEGLFTLTCGQRPLLDVSVIWGAIKSPWRKTMVNPCQSFRELHGPGLSNKCCFAIRFPCPSWLGLPPDVSRICNLSIYLSIESNLI